MANSNFVVENGLTVGNVTVDSSTSNITLPSGSSIYIGSSSILPAGTIVGTTDTQTLTNKTLTGAVMNGTVGATTPAAGAFTTLSATGITTLATTLVVTAASNSLGVVINGRSSDNLGAMYFYANDGTTNYATITTSATEFRHSAVPAASVQTFYTNASERMRIDTSGQLILKRTAAVNSATLVCSAAQNTRAVSFVNNNNNNEVGYIFLNNDGTTTQYATTSDYRLKENVTPMLGALSVVAQLKPVTYKWKINGADGQGFIAHELQAVVPDCVTGEKDGVEIYTDVDGNEQTIPKHQGIDTSFLVATLTAAIQELKAIIDTQATRIAALEAK